MGQANNLPQLSMYLFSGILVWLLFLAALYFVPKFCVKYAADVNEAQKYLDCMVEDVIEAFEDTPAAILLKFGFVSTVIVVAWPIILFLLVLAAIFSLVGVVPYLIIRKLKSTARGQ